MTHRHCVQCGLGFQEYLACERPDCGPLVDDIACPELDAQIKADMAASALDYQLRNGVPATADQLQQLYGFSPSAIAAYAQDAIHHALNNPDAQQHLAGTTVAHILGAQPAQQPEREPLICPVTDDACTTPDQCSRFVCRRERMAD